MSKVIAVSWRRWPRLLQRSVAGLLAVILLALLYLTFAGSPQPISPAQSLFAPVSVEQALLASRPELSSSDFTFRPIFAIKRVPPVIPVVVDKQENSVDEVAVDEVLESIDGLSLLGIFGSGEVAGVIIRLDNGERQRLPVGQSVKGWTVESLQPRGALFQAKTGQRASLEMAFSNDQSSEALRAPDPVPLPTAVSANPPGSASEGDADKVEAPPARITFETMYGGAPPQKTDKK